MIQFLNKWTGEIHELPDDTPEQIKDAWLALSETIKACERAKDKLKAKAEELDKQEIDGYMFMVSNVQRKNYDKSAMREQLDPDVFDILMIPDKTAVDRYIKENLDSLGEASSLLRHSMIAQGNPYQVIRLEKLSSL